MIDDNRWNLRRRWQQVVHKASVNDLSIFIVHEPLKEGSAYALGYSAMYLPLDNHGIDHSPTVVDRCIFHKRDHARCRIDLDDGPMYATGVTCMLGAVKLRVLQ